MHQRTATMQPWGCVALPTQKRGVHRRLEVAQHLGECRWEKKARKKSKHVFFLWRYGGPREVSKIVYFCICLYIFVLLGQKSPHAFLSGKKAHVASWQSLGLGGGKGEGGGEDGGWSPNGPPKRRRHETSHHEARRRKADSHTPQCNQENPRMIIHVLPDWRETRFRRLGGLCGKKSKDDKNTRNEIQKS